jgi:hypothetical protein
VRKGTYKYAAQTTAPQVLDLGPPVGTIVGSMNPLLSMDCRMPVQCKYIVVVTLIYAM